MFKLFGNRNKKQTDYSLEEQIGTLKQLGFSFQVEDEKLIDSLLYHFDREIYKEDPYDFVLTICGAELIDEENKESRLSYDVWNFDTECVEDEKIYLSIVDKFTQLSKGEFVLNHVESNVDFDNEEAWISFEFNGSQYNWDLVFDYDWIDHEFLKKLGKMASTNRGSRQYYFVNDGQHLTLIFSDRETVKKLNQILKNKYILLA